MPDMFPQPTAFLDDPAGCVLERLWMQETISNVYGSSGDDFVAIPDEFLVQLGIRFQDDGAEEVCYLFSLHSFFS
jgi:hypothetical protein